MKYNRVLILIFLIVLGILRCADSDNSVIQANDSETVSNLAINPTVVYTEQGLTLSKLIDGKKGGSIYLDTTFVNPDGDSIELNLNLLFLPGSFNEVKEITVVPEFNTASVKFLPEMTFLKPAFLDLSYKGINLTQLGFNSNSKVDFVYLADDGSIEYLLKDECKINWNKSQVYVKKAKLPHFSRYSFVRKSE